jgi:hypothetical protein
MMEFGKEMTMNKIYFNFTIFINSKEAVIAATDEPKKFLNNCIDKRALDKILR